MSDSPANDTSADMVRVHFGLLRAAGMARRSSLACALSRAVVALSRRELRERDPDASEREIALRWVALAYGDDLAKRVALYLEERDALNR